MTMSLKPIAVHLVVLIAAVVSVPTRAHAQAWPLIGEMTQRAWTYELHGFTPRGAFHERFRDIHALSLESGLAWRFLSGLELRMNGGYFHAWGETSEPLSSDPPRRSDADGLTLSYGARYYFIELGRAHLYGEAVAGFVWTPGSPFPAGGTAVNGMTRWGAGGAWRLDGLWSVELGYRRTHLSNGGGITAYNPAWEAHNLSLGLRRSLGP
ncbi:acyloxyacyl hydrolase [Hylemonella gracilis]|nr:acyloxyacyl hydrolase [Hylemonella gracilis]